MKSATARPQLAVGVMTWSEARGLARLLPAQTAYRAADRYEEESRALEKSLEAGVNLFDTAGMPKEPVVSPSRVW